MARGLMLLPQPSGETCVDVFGQLLLRAKGRSLPAGWAAEQRLMRGEAEAPFHGECDRSRQVAVACRRLADHQQFRGPSCLQRGYGVHRHTI